MFFELQDRGARDEIYRLHAQMIEAALVRIFEFDEGRAKTSVASLLRRYADAPEGERDFFVHEDPVNLAAEIAQQPNVARDAVRGVEPFASRLKSYNENVRSPTARQARAHYETNVRPIFDKLKLG